MPAKELIYGDYGLCGCSLHRLRFTAAAICDGFGLRKLRFAGAAVGGGGGCGRGGGLRRTSLSVSLYIFLRTKIAPSGSEEQGQLQK